MRAELNLRPTQSVSVSPRLKQAVRLLQMSSLDYALTLRAELAQNPFLEFGDNDVEEADFEPAVVAGPEATDDADVDHADEAELLLGDVVVDSHDLNVDDDVQGGDDRDSWADVATTGAGGGDDADRGEFDRRAAEITLARHLHGQLGLLSLDGRDRVLAQAVIESLDDDGYLRLELGELAGITALKPLASEDELRIALCRVQSFDPPGVGARSVVECLTLQAESIVDPVERDLVRAIVDQGLDVVAKRDTDRLARALGCSKTMVEAAFVRIRSFDPRPGWRHGSADVRYIAPDVVMRRVRGQWTAQLNDAVVPRVRLHRVYEEMFERQRRRSHTEMARQLVDARWALRNVEQRFATILAVAQAIVAHQAAFFEYGPLAMRPLTLSQIADEVGVHTSTVCRVTNGKYIGTPVGVLELKHFFSRGLPAIAGGVTTGTAIRAAVARLLQEESPARPMSDAKLTQALARQGVTVTRRAVTKYRQILGIETVQRRRRAPGETPDAG